LRSTRHKNSFLIQFHVSIENNICHVYSVNCGGVKYGTFLEPLAWAYMAVTSWKPQLPPVGSVWTKFLPSSQISMVLASSGRNDLWEKLELKLPPPLQSVAALPCEKQMVIYTALQHS